VRPSAETTVPATTMLESKSVATCSKGLVGDVAQAATRGTFSPSRVRIGRPGCRRRPAPILGWVHADSRVRMASSSWFFGPRGSVVGDANIVLKWGGLVVRRGPVDRLRSFGERHFGSVKQGVGTWDRLRPLARALPVELAVGE
jgi:hypothetical protein